MGNAAYKVKHVAQRRRLFHRFEFCVVLSVSFLVSLLPRRVMTRVGRFLGGLACRLWKARREIAIANLDLAFGETKTPEEKERIAEQSFKNVGATLIELAWGMRRMNEKVFSEVVQVEGLDILTSALSKGRGAIVLPAHFGNWEIMAGLCGYLESGAYYVAKRLKNPYLDRAVNDYRCRTGNQVIYMNGASKKMEDALRNGNIVATVLDQKVPLHRGGILVDFFGQPAATAPLIAELHLATLAPLIHIRCYPLSDGKCRLVVGPEVHFQPSGRYEEDIHSLTQECVAYMESYIRETPHLWIWAHKRWKVDSGRTKEA